MATLNICPVDTNLCFTRGDSIQWTFTIKLAGVAVDISGFQYTLTVDPSDEPANATNNLFALVGTLTDPTNGIVEFSMTPAQSDQTPGDYFFDLQQVDGASKIRTVAKGGFEFKQDITK